MQSVVDSALSVLKGFKSEENHKRQYKQAKNHQKININMKSENIIERSICIPVDNDLASTSKYFWLLCDDDYLSVVEPLLFFTYLKITSYL